MSRALISAYRKSSAPHHDRLSDREKADADFQ
jgi:hypothetical protein